MSNVDDRDSCVQGTGHYCSADEKQRIVEDVLAEWARAEAKFPWWPEDLVHGAAILVEEAGETIQAALEARYEKDKATRSDVRKEAVQTGAMALRLIAWLDRTEN